MNKLLFLFLSVSGFGFGQEYSNTKLSSKYDFLIKPEKAKTAAGFSECKITIKIKDKVSAKAQSINIVCEMIYEGSFEGNDTTMSYTTGFNKNRKIADNDYGDLVVADFNFDGREDLAVKKEEGGNGGPLYNYYLQDKDAKFVINDFLSNEMTFFPAEINAKRRTLMTLVHANAYQVSETIYRLDFKSAKWKQISQRFIGGKE